MGTVLFSTSGLQVPRRHYELGVSSVSKWWITILPWIDADKSQILKEETFLSRKILILWCRRIGLGWLARRKLLATYVSGLLGN